MSTPQIREQLGAIHEDIRTKVEQHFNKDQEYRKYAVCKLSCRSETEYERRLGDEIYHPWITDASFDVYLADLTDMMQYDPFSWAISCIVRIQSTGEIYIDGARYSSKTVL